MNYDFNKSALTDSRSPVPERLNEIMDEYAAPQRYGLSLPSDFTGDGSGSSALHVTRERDMGLATRSVAKQVQRVLASDLELFASQLISDGAQSRFVVVMFGQGEELLRAMAIVGDLGVYFPDHIFNPHVELLRDEWDAVSRLVEGGIASIRTLTGPPAVQFVDEANALIQRIRTRGRTRDFVKALGNLDRQCRKNANEAGRYIDRVFDFKGSRQLFGRLDIALKSVDEGSPICQQVTLDVMTGWFEKFMRHVRDHYPMTGYLWKLECGLDTGYHYHLLLAFNGHQVREDITILDTLGRYWAEVVTAGQGRFHNCNRNKYRYRAIGMMEHDDAEMRANLKKYVLGYLTKTDFWLRFTKGRTFGKGQMPTGIRHRGRPRRPEAEQDAAT